MTPQWRLSLKDLGQSGNGTVPRQNNARKKPSGTRQNAGPTKLGASYKATATRGRERVRDRNAPAANSHGGKKRNELPDDNPARFLFRSEAAKVCVMQRRAYIRVVTMEQ